jgi:hypothetical protein
VTRSRLILTLALAATALATAVAITAPAQSQSKAAVAYAADGKVVAPTNYRDWVFLSSGLDMTYGTAAPEGAHRFDNVFVDPASYRSFQANGVWPDKTVMVLEVRNAGQNVSINKAGYMQQSIAGVQLHVKDAAKGGWAFYAVDPKGATTRFPDKSACRACHESSGSVDGTFVQFYPTLIDAAKKAGTLKAGE